MQHIVLCFVRLKGDRNTRAVSGSSEPVVPECQRLVANPFLGLLLLVCACESFRESLARKNLALFIIGIGLSVVAILVVQYHCLDCGKTGWFWRASGHACTAVIARRQNGGERRFRGPGLKLQLAGWFILLFGALVLGLVTLSSWR
jgi:hypothetical protein